MLNFPKHTNFFLSDGFQRSYGLFFRSHFILVHPVHQEGRGRSRGRGRDRQHPQGEEEEGGGARGGAGALRAAVPRRGVRQRGGEIQDDVQIQLRQARLPEDRAAEGGGGVPQPQDRLVPQLPDQQRGGHHQE